MKTKLLLLFAILLTGCKEANTSAEPESGQNSEIEQGQNLTNYQIERTDGFADCEYLAVVGNLGNKSTSSNRDVFKIDKDGNMAAMIFYFTYYKGSNGGTKDTCANIKVIPERIQSYLNEYTGFYDCLLYDEKGELLREVSYSETGYRSERFVKCPDLIIRNRDGAIFEGRLPIKETYRPLSMALDKDKNLYYVLSYGSGGNIYKFWTDDKKSLQQQINPKDMLFKQFTLTNQPGVLVAGTIIDGVYRFYINFDTEPTILFPNGGFKVIKAEPEVSTGHKRTLQQLICVGDVVKLMTVSDSAFYDDSYRYQNYCKISIESIKIANHTYTKELERSVVLDMGFPSSYYGIYFSFNCKNHYVFGATTIIGVNGNSTLLAVCDHNSSEIRFVKPEKFPLAQGRYSIGNVIFRMNETTNTIDSYDFETLTYKEVPYDDSALGDFHETGRSMTPNPATIIRYGARGTDGRSVVVETDVLTGEVTIKELGDNRSFTTLVRLD